MESTRSNHDETNRKTLRFRNLRVFNARFRLFDGVGGYDDYRHRR